MTITSSFMSSIRARGVSIAVSLRTSVLLMSSSLGLGALRVATHLQARKVDRRQSSGALDDLALHCIALGNAGLGQGLNEPAVAGVVVVSIYKRRAPV